MEVLVDNPEVSNDLLVLTVKKNTFGLNTLWLYHVDNDI